MLHRLPGIIGRLGTAARRNVGTGAGQVVALDTSAKLPAVDGSQLTGITTSVAADLELTIAELAMNQADLFNTATFLGSSGNRFADSFDALTYVNTGAATNLDSGTAGLLKPSTGSSVISAATGTAIGTMTAFGGLAASFDSVTSQASGSGSAVGSASGYVGKNYSSSPKKIFKVTAFGSNDKGFSDVNASTTLTLYGKNGSAPANETDGTSLGSINFTDTANESAGRDITSSDTATAWDYVWVRNSSPSAGVVYFAELQFYSPVTNNLTVKSTGLTAASVPSSMKLIALVKHVDSATAGTDYKFKVARDGTNLSSYLTLNDRFVIPGGSVHVIESNAIDVTGITSGTTPLWQFETFNNKMVELQAIYFYWT